MNSGNSISIIYHVINLMSECNRLQLQATFALENHLVVIFQLFYVIDCLSGFDFAYYEIDEPSIDTLSPLT